MADNDKQLDQEKQTSQQTDKQKNEQTSSQPVETEDLPEEEGTNLAPDEDVEEQSTPDKDQEDLDEEKQAQTGAEEAVPQEEKKTDEPKEEGEEEGEKESKKEEEPMFDKQTMVNGLLILLGVIGLLAIGRFAVPRVLVYLTQAARPTKFSLSNSYVFGAPLSVPADGETKIRINAFLLNDEGMGVPDKTIDIEAEPKGEARQGNLQLESVQPTTDEFGKAVFEVTSSDPGQYIVTALVNGVEFPQTVTLTFR